MSSPTYKVATRVLICCYIFKEKKHLQQNHLSFYDLFFSPSTLLSPSFSRKYHFCSSRFLLSLTADLCPVLCCGFVVINAVLVSQTPKEAGPTLLFWLLTASAPEGNRSTGFCTLHIVTDLLVIFWSSPLNHQETRVVKILQGRRKG